MDIEFILLKTLHESINVSQRKLSKECGVSLGKINKELKTFEKEGYIEIIGHGQHKKYHLTDVGVKTLENNISKYNKTKLQVTHVDKEKKISKAVILAAGSQKEFISPPTLLEVGGCSLIERMIKILKELSITEIIVVGGYEIGRLKDVLDDDINIVYNHIYSETGSMHSLQLAKEYIDDDFILIEGDLIFEKSILENIINSEYRDCACITKATMIGDELYVEIRDELIYKLSKDIRQFNSIDGKFMGITKLSSKLYKLMLEEYSKNRNPLINYEFTLLDVARKYNINYIFVDNLIWGEVNNLLEYEYVKDIVYKKIKATE